MSMKYPQLVDVEATVRGPLGVAGIPHGADRRRWVIVARHPGAFPPWKVKSWVEQGLAA